MSLLEKIIETKDFLVEKGLTEPEFGLILGSGLGEMAEEVENAIIIGYADIPNWGKSTVAVMLASWFMGIWQGPQGLGTSRTFPFL